MSTELERAQSELQSTARELKSTASELKSTESELKGSQEESHHRLLELEVLYRAAPVGLAFLDHELRYLRVNEALANINGLSVEAHIGRYASEINPVLAKIVTPMMVQVMASNQPLLQVEITVLVPVRNNIILAGEIDISGGRFGCHHTRRLWPPLGE